MNFIPIQRKKYVDRKIRIGNGDDKLTFWIHTPVALGTLTRADVIWNLDYTSLYTYCLWRCTSNLKITNVKLIDFAKKYVNDFLN